MVAWRVWAGIFVTLGIRCVLGVVVVIQFGCEQFYEHGRRWGGGSAGSMAASAGQGRGGCP